jgi:hypothetical protein
VIDFLTMQNRPGGIWEHVGAEEQCELFKSFSHNYMITPKLIREVREEIKELYPLKAENYKENDRQSNDDHPFSMNQEEIE